MGRTVAMHEGPRPIEARLVLGFGRVKRKILFARFTSVNGYYLPFDALHTGYDIKMAIPAQKRKIVLATESGNPNIVCWNWLTDLPQFQDDRSVAMSRLVRDVQDQGVG